MDDTAPPLPLTAAELDELRRIRSAQLDQTPAGHDRVALQSLIDRGLVAPGLHNELTYEGERALEHAAPEAMTRGAERAPDGPANP